MINYTGEFKTQFNWKANAGSGDVLAWINTVRGTPKTVRFAKHTSKLNNQINFKFYIPHCKIDFNCHHRLLSISICCVEDVVYLKK